MFLLSFTFLAGIGNALLSLQLESYEEAKLQWVQHTHAIMEETEQLFSYMKDAETGQRGYLLTNTISYLKPYHRGIVNAKKSFSDLKALTEGDRLQQERLQSIKTLMDLEFAMLAETIQSVEKNKGDNREAIALIKQHSNNQYMDDIRAIFSEFKKTESVLLKERASEFKKRRLFILAAIIVEIVIFILVAIITVIFLNRNLFFPLKLLIANIRKMEQGAKVNISDVHVNDEMGYLLSRFFKMYEKIEERTKQLTFTATHDKLTGLNNRVNLYSEIENAINAQREFGTHFAVLFLDLNKFKLLNDTVGHDAGDFILTETARHLKESVRAHDIVFRVGGDEFVILINDVDEVVNLQKIADKLLTASATPVMYKEKMLQISLSLGIAMSNKEIKNSEQIVTYADVAMYEAKRDKKSSYQFFDVSMLKRSSDTRTQD